MLKNCQFCEKEFEDARGVAKFCSANCRKTASKRRIKAVSPVSDTSVAEDLITQKEELDKNILVEDRVKDSEKKCAGCGVKVHPLVCICADCLKEGKTHETLGLTCHTIEEVKKKD